MIWLELEPKHSAAGVQALDLFCSTTQLTSLVGQMVKNPPAMQETWVPPLGQKDPLEKRMATHSSILARKFPWKEEPGRLSTWGHKELGMTE